MRHVYFLFAAALITIGVNTLGVSVGYGQKPDTEELRKQIKEAQKKLELLEQSIEDDDRATQVGNARREDDGTTMIVRLYDLGDLFTIAPDYRAQTHTELGKNPSSLFPSREDTELTGGLGAMGGAGFNITAESALGPVKMSIDRLVDAILTTISPTEWDEVGGAGSIAALGNSLLVSTNVKNHQQIDDLLELFRKRWGTLRTVSVRSRWLWLTDGELNELLVQPGNNLREVKAYGLVDETQWKQHLTKIADPKNKIPAGYQAQITCHHGQTVHTLSGQQRLAVTGMIPSVGGGDVGFKPMVAVIQEGAALQITPIVTTGGKTVILDIHSRVCELDDSANATSPANKAVANFAPNGALATVAALDRTKMMVHRLSTTIRLPADRVMLVGGMTYGKQPAAGEPSLYLFVKLSVQELRDDAPTHDSSKAKEKSLAPAKAANEGETLPAPKK